MKAERSRWTGQVRVPVEIALRAEGTYADIFNEVEVDLIFTGPTGPEMRVPAFWAGGGDFSARFSAPGPGTYSFVSAATAEGDAGLHGVKGSVEIAPYSGDNPLYRHGPLRVAEGRRHLEHEDGRPFLWLGDTWWMGLGRRIHWPQEFRGLAEQRKRQGYSVIQIIAGPLPDMAAFDPRGANEAGQFPWEEEFARVNPAYYDAADRRIACLVETGLLPCIVGCWGYYLPQMGIDRMKRHWRNLVARYAAYPVTWCLAGEASMPYYLSDSKKEDGAFQKSGWTDLGRYLHRIDPYRRPVTIHPTQRGRDQVDDDGVLDFEMLQTGHDSSGSSPESGDHAITNTIRVVSAAVVQEPRMPVLVAEVAYEGIMGRCGQEVQRFMFWTGMLRGACGHTYGANGIWQMSRADDPYGASPHGFGWGNTPWQEAAQLPGGRQVGLGKRFLERYPWWQLEPHQEDVAPHGKEAPGCEPLCARFGDGGRIVFQPSPLGPWLPPYRITNLEPGARYRVLSFDPCTGEEKERDDLVADADGAADLPFPSIIQDWVFVLERRGEAGER